jgi:hypothetical protein
MPITTKAWFASLDKQRGADDNPTAQISNYPYRPRVRWGILTNGRSWRLHEREKSSASGICYEVDLEELLQRGDLEAFKYFYLFFRREVFLPIIRVCRSSNGCFKAVWTMPHKRAIASKRACTMPCACS